MTIRNRRTPWGLIAACSCVGILRPSYVAGAQQGDVSGIISPTISEPARLSTENATKTSEASASTQDGPGATVAPPSAESVPNAAREGAASQAVPPVPETAPKRGFFNRLFDAYAADWKETSSTGPEPAFRGYPAPEANPPYPFTVWPYGGSPVIGQPDANVPPLMQAIYGGDSGKAWEHSRVKIYGWVNYGGNLSTSSQKNGYYSNLPAAYPEIPNTVQLDQATLYIERLPDTVQTDHFDWGFRPALDVAGQRLAWMRGGPLDRRCESDRQCLPGHYLEQRRRQYLQLRERHQRREIRLQQSQRLLHSKYTEHALSFNHWIGSTVVFRPELRYEYAYDQPAYNGGTSKSQFMAAGDFVFFY